jgi:hypothetical protein
MIFASSILSAVLFLLLSGTEMKKIIAEHDQTQP